MSNILDSEATAAGCGRCLPAPRFPLRTYSGVMATPAQCLALARGTRKCASFTTRADHDVDPATAILVKEAESQPG